MKNRLRFGGKAARMEGWISVREGGQVVPIVPHVVRRHARLAARGVHVEYHAIGATEFAEREPRQHNFFLYAGRPARAEIKSPDFSGMRWICPGALWVMPQGCRHRVRFEGPVEGVALAFDPGVFERLVESSGGSRPDGIVQSLAASPPKIEHLMRALNHESSQPSTEDHFGLECIATAIALALSQHAGTMKSSAKSGERLAPRQIRVVEAYVEAHLEGSIALAELAGAVGLSSFHFLRGFRQTVGMTPGRYVLERRMERAKWLLRSSGLTVGEVGLGVGYEHASHFTRAFRGAVGVTPSAFRREL